MILDIFKYFARFVPKESLEKIFQLPVSDDYLALKEEVLADVSDHRLEGLTDFVFGADVALISKRITDIRGTYLCVEFATVSSTVDPQVDVKTDLIRVGVTVATPHPDNYDLVSTAIDQDKTLALISAIRQYMRDDDDPQRGIYWMDYPATLSVWSSKELANSHGWTMQFNIKGVNVI